MSKKKHNLCDFMFAFLYMLGTTLKGKKMLPMPGANCCRLQLTRFSDGQRNFNIFSYPKSVTRGQNGNGAKETVIWAKAIGRGHLYTLDTCLV